MSALCLYSCGNYTDEEDGVCVKCRGYSKARKIIDGINIENSNSSVIPAKAGIQVKPLDRPIKSDDDRKTNGGAKLTKDHCNVDGCGRATLKKGLCYKHLVEKHGDAALPPSMRKGNSGTKIVGGVK